ncbi:MFS transporter [Dongia rigui]|uniref:MFS transporter n=1 Tax=Dongia rigui TaxID=940149 RepID=A0ABU5DZH8_9PROT|nr:MFS transporter [Dongia rigui]MDY0872736.1 MFS transporter [Dongia rigui]
MSQDLAIGATTRQRFIALAGLYASVFTFGISFGGLVPWMALHLDAQGLDGALIGLISAAHPVGVMLMAPFTQRIVRRFGSGNAMIFCSVVGVAAMFPLGLTDSPWIWLGLRFISGLSGSVPWVVTETWINSATSSETRGRAVAFYAAIMAAGFAAGPEVLKWSIHFGASALPWLIGLSVLSLLIILPLRRLAPAMDDSGGAHVLGVFLTLPALLSAAVVSGSIDASFFSFLAIWGQRVGFEESFALTLLSVFIAGNVLLQFPVGWMADRMGPRPVMLGCGVVCIIGPLLALSGLTAYPIWLGLVAFIWGGCVWGAYSVALVAMGRRYAGGELAVVNAAFVMAYTFANVAAPPASGLAMDVIGTNGLMLVALAVAASFTLLVFLRRREF